MDMCVEFSPPFNWCDGRCEVCLLASDCPVCVRAEQQRWVHSARGEDPDDPDVVMDDVARDLTRSIELLQHIADKEGICLDGPLPCAPVSLSSKRLQRKGRQFIKVLCEVQHSGAVDPEALSEVIGYAGMLVAKTGRLAAYDDPSDPVWFADAAPNLMLMEHLLRSVTTSLEALRGQVGPQAFARVDGACSELRHELDGLLSTIPDSARALMSMLARTGRAPSPFTRHVHPPAALATRPFRG